jgi:uncharacterized protein
MEIRLGSTLEDIPAGEWNALAGTDSPFLRHEFLVALERHGGVGARYGWLPRYLGAYDRGGRLLGAVPLYVKDNSYGEFVFDWSWADAYRRAGLAYYPKLVAAVPYTPVTGPRILVGGTPERERVADALAAAAVEYAREHGFSSLHWLFTPDEETRRLEGYGLLRRTGCQFHWENRGYRDFGDYLDEFSAVKRKKVKRERRRVQESGIEIEVLSGTQMSDVQWEVLSEFYRTTFLRKGGTPTLAAGFFREIGRTMGEQLVLVLAQRKGRYIAGAINLRGPTALYGRHWGCSEEFHSLHFEACYYQGIEYCIRHGLRRFEPGAQGEHKVSRGFLPTPTWSVHWIAHAGLRTAIGEFLARESVMMQNYIAELAEHSPFKDLPVADARRAARGE